MATILWFVGVVGVDVGSHCKRGSVVRRRRQPHHKRGAQQRAFRAGIEGIFHRSDERARARQSDHGKQLTQSSRTRDRGESAWRAIRAGATNEDATSERQHRRKQQTSEWKTAKAAAAIKSARERHCETATLV